MCRRLFVRMGARIITGCLQQNKSVRDRTGEVEGVVGIEWGSEVESM